MGMSVYDATNGGLDEFAGKYHISTVLTQIRELSGRFPYCTMSSLFEAGSHIRYILWSEKEISAVVEEYFLNRDINRHLISNGAAEKSFYNLVFNYASDTLLREHAFAEILNLTDRNLVIGLEPNDENSSLFYSGRRYVKSNVVWVGEDVKDESMRTKYSLVECLTTEQPVLTTQSFFEREDTQEKRHSRQRNFFELAVSKAGSVRRLFYPQ